MMDVTGAEASYFFDIPALQVIPTPAAPRRGPTPPEPDLVPDTLNTPVYTTTPAHSNLLSPTLTSVFSLNPTYSHGAPPMTKIEDQSFIHAQADTSQQSYISARVQPDVDREEENQGDGDQEDGGRGDGGQPEEGDTQH